MLVLKDVLQIKTAKIKLLISPFTGRAKPAQNLEKPGAMLLLVKYLVKKNVEKHQNVFISTI